MVQLIWNIVITITTVVLALYQNRICKYVGRCLMKIPPSVNGTCKLMTHFNYSFSNRHSFLEDRSICFVSSILLKCFSNCWNVSAMALDTYHSIVLIRWIRTLSVHSPQKCWMFQQLYWMFQQLCHHSDDCRNDDCNTPFYSTLT